MVKRKKQKATGCLISISAADLIMPYFLIEGKQQNEPVTTMPGIARLSIDNLLKDIEQTRKLGIKAILLFGVCPSKSKDEAGSYAYFKEGIVPQAVAAIKRQIKDITVMTDVCLCAYTSHGHCGVIEKGAREIQAKATLDALSRMSLVHAQAGADWVAPSAMARAQVLAIRQTLDKHGYQKTKILGYSAKFASHFYGPFREAADSAAQFGDRRAYQLNYTDAHVALREISDDIKEGADMVMVKPALSYLDVIKEAKLKFSYALAAYNVSGEYAFVKYGARQGLWDERGMVTEILTSIKRAGADLIITYHAQDIARWCADGGK